MAFRNQAQQPQSQTNNASTSPKAAQMRPPSIEIAMVANAQAGHSRPCGCGLTLCPGRYRCQSGGCEERGTGRARITLKTLMSLPTGKRSTSPAAISATSRRSTLPAARLLWQRPLNTGRADHMTLTPDGRSLFVSALMDNRVYKIAAATGEITGHLVTGVYPHDNKVSRDGRRLYNTSIGPLGLAPTPGQRSATDGDAGLSLPVDHRRRRQR